MCSRGGWKIRLSNQTGDSPGSERKIITMIQVGASFELKTKVTEQNTALAVGSGVRMMVSTDWTATFHFTLLPLVICTPILIVFAILIPYICFKNLEKQSIVERLRATD